MAIFDFIKGLFDDKESVKQGDIVSAFKQKYPAYAKYDDAVIATRLGKKYPQEYPFLAGEYVADADVPPALVPKEFRGEKFYERNQSLRIEDATKELDDFKAKNPAYKDVEPLKLATALEKKFPDQYKGLSSRLQIPEPTPTELKAPDEPLLGKVINGVENFLIKRPSEAAPVVREFLSDQIAGTLAGKPDVPATRENIFKIAEQTGKVPYTDIVNRTLAELIPDMIPLTPTEVATYAAAGRAFDYGVSKLSKIPFFQKSLSEIPKVMQEWITTKNVKVPIDREVVKDFFVFGKEKLSPEVYDFLTKMPKDELVRMLKSREAITANVRVPRFGGGEQPPAGLRPSSSVPSDNPLVPLGEGAASEPITAFNAPSGIAERTVKKAQTGANATPEPSSTALNALGTPNAEVRTPVAPIEGTTPKSLRSIVFDVSKDLGQKVTFGKPSSRQAAGTYYPGTAATVVRFSGDLDTTAHELAHSLDDKIGIVSDLNRFGEKEAPFDHELEKFWITGSVKPDSNMQYKRAEGVAEFVRAWLVNPEAAKAQAPNFAKYFEAKVPAPALQSLQKFSQDIRSFAGASAHDKIFSNVEWKPPESDLFNWVAGKDLSQPGFQITWADKARANWENSLHPFNKAVDYARWQGGVRELLPEDDPKILARLLAGEHAKLDQIFEAGMIKADNTPATPGGIKWLMEPLDDTSPQALNKELEETATYMIAQRTVEKVDKGLEASIQKVQAYEAKRLAEIEDRSAKIIKKIEENFNRPAFKNKVDRARVNAINDLKAKTRERILSLEKQFGKLSRNLQKKKGNLALKKYYEVFNEHKARIKKIGEAAEKALKKIEDTKSSRIATVNRLVAKAKARIQEISTVRQAKVAVAAKRRIVSGIGGGLVSDYEVAQGRVAQMEKGDPAKLARIKEAAGRYRQWADSVLQYMVDKGRLSQEAVAAIRKNNEQYVAMNRIMEVSPNEEVATFKGKGSGRSLGSVFQPIKKFKGSARTIQNPYTSLLDSTYRAVREADRNDVLLAFRELLTGSRHFGEGKPQDLASVGRLAKEGEKDSLTIFVDGKPERWQFHPDVYKALKGIVDTPSRLHPIMTFLPSLFRKSIINFPPFLIRNVIRDFQDRSMISRTGSTIMDQIKARGPMDIGDLKLYGGDQAGHYLRDKVDYARAMETAIEDLSKDDNSFVGTGKDIFKAYLRLTEASERTGRMAEFRSAFKHAKEKLGMDDYNAQLYAAYQARDLMDFAVMGHIMRELVNPMIPFSNAAIQGLFRKGRAFNEDPKGFMTRWGLYALLPTISAWAWNRWSNNLDEYRQQPAYIRDLFYNFKVGPNLWLRIPKPFEVGVLASGVERALDKIAGNENAFEGYAGSLARAVLPVDESALAGPFKGIIEAIANYNMFAQRNIVPPDENQLALELRNTKYASRLGKLLQPVFKVDARKMDFIMREMFGFFGEFATAASDTGRPDKRGVGLKQTGLFVESPAFNARDVQWVMSKAAERGLDRNVEYRLLKNRIREYFDAKGSEAKNRAAKIVIAEAQQIRSRWEESTPLSKNRKIRKKMLELETANGQ